ncbi:MAG: carbonic anhydrase, partial [Bacteroidales bacterium]|nr:carbonic anhydrase [Bacteroidales bacterium]
GFYARPYRRCRGFYSVENGRCRRLDRRPCRRNRCLSAMRSLIVAIYELGVNEIMVVAHSHCGACHMSYDHFHNEMISRGITDETLDTIRKCGINLDHWLEGFKDTPESVRKTVETIKTHPLVPKDIVVRGFIIDSETGALDEIKM